MDCFNAIIMVVIDTKLYQRVGNFVVLVDFNESVKNVQNVLEISRFNRLLNYSNILKSN